MNHRQGGNSDHSAHVPRSGSDPTEPIDLPVPLSLGESARSASLVAQILVSRAQSISSNPGEETVVLVAHGPVSDQENVKWLADMASLAEQMKTGSSFKDIRYLTVRDDAPAPIRDQATAELRQLIEGIKTQKRRALLVPLLLSYGGIERGIRKRLEGLDYTFTSQPLLPDERLVDWVLLSAREVLGPAEKASR